MQMRKVTGKLNNDFGEITSLTVPYDLVVSGSNHYVYLVTDEEVGVLKKLYKFDKNHKVIFDYLFKSSYMPV